MIAQLTETVELFHMTSAKSCGGTTDQLQIVLWSTQRLSTFVSTQRISRHVDIIFNISTKEQWKNKMSIITHEAASLGPKRHINKLRAL